ncbi:flavin reductase family protein [Chitinophaga filiformis]|uniref:flavin reductase family protein n=1 Tax=Chitinophaga filiformis TaxID=104663 RepID=UPI001F47E4C6|nr:flavin reductase family protein [Chitinophaga filiformis]MCF6401648.1 flavin reductase family protein [Chitinophaga filiformis]
MQIIPGQIKTAQLHNYLQGAIAPRPICFASTVDKDGHPNLSPFSFFNLFGSNPATLIFSPSRRVRDNTTKHTLENVLETMEVVINVVTYAMVQQASLSSCEYPRGVNEFEKAGFTPQPSEKVKPFRVKESPVQFECIVREVLPQGREGGAGNLVICEPVLIHINDAILNENGVIDPHKIDLVARMGGDYYCRASGAAVFEVAKPLTELGIGIDALPPAIRQSSILTGNNLGQLANVQQQPTVDPAFDDDHLKNIIQYYSITPDEMEKELHRHAQRLLEQGRVQDAWQVLLAGTV